MITISSFHFQWFFNALGHHLIKKIIFEFNHPKNNNPVQVLNRNSISDNTTKENTHYQFEINYDFRFDVHSCDNINIWYSDCHIYTNKYTTNWLNHNADNIWRINSSLSLALLCVTQLGPFCWLSIDFQSNALNYKCIFDTLC